MQSVRVCWWKATDTGLEICSSEQANAWMQNKQHVTCISSYFSTADILRRPGSPSHLPTPKPPSLSGQVRLLGCNPQKLNLIGIRKMTRVKNANCRVGHKPKDRTAHGSSASKARSLFRVCLQDDSLKLPSLTLHVSQAQTLRRNIIIGLSWEKTLLERVRCLSPSEQSKIGIAIAWHGSIVYHIGSQVKPVPNVRLGLELVQ